MLKTLKRTLRLDREKFAVPKSVQDIIPVKAVYEDGIFLVGRNKYSKTYWFSDINYATASKEDAKHLFLLESDLLNSLDSETTSKLTVMNRRINEAEFEGSILMLRKGDGLDRYREEYNRLVMDKATGSDKSVRQRYLTVSCYRKSVDDARGYFRRVHADIAAHLARLGSRCSELGLAERLRLLHDFYRAGEEGSFRFDLRETMRKGHSFKDFICPDCYENAADHFRIGGRCGRVFYLREYASFIKDSILTDLTEACRDLTVSIDILPVPTDEAVREVEKRLLGVEKNVADWQMRQNRNNNFSAVVPYDLEQQRRELKEFLDDVTTRDQRMMLAVMTLVLTADTMESLDADTEALLSAGRKHLCQFSCLKYQQLDGMKTALPVGTRRIDAFRTLTTESLASFMPYRVQEIMDTGGLYFGENAISRNLIMVNKERLMNPNAFLLGVPGAGKSFSAKEHIAFLALSTDDDILICDPEREYASLVDALGGEVIRIAAGSEDHINALDMTDGYGDSADPIYDKSEFVLSLFSQLDAGGIGSKERSLIDRCTRDIYTEHRKGGPLPTLALLHDRLAAQDEPLAQGLALSLEIFTSGSLDAFAHPTNVRTDSRIVVYDIMDLGKALKTMGLLVITDQMLNRVTENWRRGRRTHIFLDEFHVVFENEHSGAFFNSAWRRFRKRNAYPTAITQNVEYLLDSVLASTMLSNSEFIVMLNQAASDRARLAKLLNISEEQMGYITNAEAGSGLIRYGNALVPFVNRFPKDTELYRLMTTKPTEDSAWIERSGQRK
jgi:hypothetical protein